ncbi:MAG: hypothetical protein JNK11_02345 [Alphaproteobacteria bacterium]|nr:hypothetical protein [Alphaproteobacteria bacterium]
MPTETYATARPSRAARLCGVLIAAAALAGLEPACAMAQAAQPAQKQAPAPGGQAGSAPLGRAVDSGAKTAAPAATAAPRFVSLRSRLVHLRTGPGTQYPIDWVYLRRGLPMEVVQQFEEWRRVRDWQGTEGWTHHTNLTNERTVIVVGGGERLVRERSSERANVVARAEPGVIFRLSKCDAQWCQVEKDEHRGWIKRGEVWGIPPEEGLAR